MKSKLSVQIVFIILSSCSLFAQHNDILSLSNGNIWFYEGFRSMSSPGGQSKYDIYETKKIISDSLIDGINRKIVLITKESEYYKSQITEYWYIENGIFYIFDRPFYNQNIVNDTTFNLGDVGYGSFYYVNLFLKNLNVWGEQYDSQVWNYTLASSINVSTQTELAKGLGITTESFSLDDMIISEYTYKNLKGAIIEGLQYGLIPTSVEFEKHKLSNIFNEVYPNPFNLSTTISYEIENSCNVSISIYDLHGKKITRLVDEFKAPGRYSFIFNTEHLNLSSGVYFCRMKAGDFFEVKKLILSK
jgi:hypothetical protein